MSFLKAWFPDKEAGDQSIADVLARLLHTLRDGAIVVGDGTRIVAANSAANEAFGRGVDLIEGRRLTEVIRDLTLHQAFQAALDEKKTSEVELEIIGHEPKRYEVRISPVELPGFAGAVGYFHDVTRVEKLERMRNEFLSNVSHELRTPLTSIMAFVETLEDGAIDDPENNLRFLGVIQRNAERMHRLIDDILELTSIESGTVSISPKECRLDRVVDEIFTSLSGKARESGVTLVNSVSEGSAVYADPMRLEQMLLNLVDNGIKFNRQQGTVDVRSEVSGDRILIHVSDSGEGISAEHLGRLFERFYRVDKARSREIGGTGLGLAITKHLALLHGGEVSVSSTIGSGTTFTIELPVTNGQALTVSYNSP
jgi:two-component system phosphate regulon sensor histidine kinase PhoR